MIDVQNLPLEYFEKFKKKNNAKRYSDDCNDFELRESIRDDLMKKQRGQCAYCERKITKEKSTIEHINPRDKSPKLECEYSNIILSCQSEDSCDRFKGAKIWDEKLVHPVLNDPTEFFEFSHNGEILSLDENGKNTIEILNLNSNKLKRLRENIILYQLKFIDLENIEHENLIKQYT